MAKRLPLKGSDVMAKHHGSGIYDYTSQTVELFLTEGQSPDANYRKTYKMIIKAMAVGSTPTFDTEFFGL